VNIILCWNFLWPTPWVASFRADHLVSSPSVVRSAGSSIESCVVYVWLISFVELYTFSGADIFVDISQRLAIKSTSKVT